MKKIIALVVVLAVVISVTIGVVAALSGPIGIVDPTDLASPGGNALQNELQAYATENYPYYKIDMFYLLKDETVKLSVNDFCNDLYFSEVSDSKNSLVLKPRTGFYIGPIAFLDDQGNEIWRSDFAISLNVGSQMPAKYANYTLVALDEINPKFKEEFKWFDIK